MTSTKPIYLTPDGKKKLEEELDYLRTTRRREVAAAIMSAKEEGDLSENSAYDEAKNAQAFLEGRIQTLESQLKESILIKPPSNSDTVIIGSTVTLQEEGFDEEETYQIVGSTEADPTNGSISNESPIGKAVMGKKINRVVTVHTPSGDLRFKIIKIE